MTRNNCSHKKLIKSFRHLKSIIRQVNRCWEDPTKTLLSNITVLPPAFQILLSLTCLCVFLTLLWSSNVQNQICESSSRLTGRLFIYRQISYKFLFWNSSRDVTTPWISDWWWIINIFESLVLRCLHETVISCHKTF